MIEFRNVEVSFRQKGEVFTAVKDVSFVIESGEIFGIVGSSGAGKSTLLRTINLLQVPTTGQVLIDGEAVEGYRGAQLRSLRRNIGMIFQHFNLAESKTVYQNIAFVLKSSGYSKAEIDSRVRELLQMVNLSDKMDAYPSSLSGGQKQRVAIARALANNANILLCDEPTSALDLETTNSILQLLKELNQRMGITVVLITHELDVVKAICNRMAVMDQGSLVELGEVFQIFTNAKNSFTQGLLRHTTKFDVPEKVLQTLKGKIIQLIYRGENANNPILSYAAATFQIGFNILLGRIEYINEIPLGVLYVQLLGEEENIRLAIEYLRENTARLEVITDAGV